MHHERAGTVREADSSNRLSYESSNTAAARVTLSPNGFVNSGSVKYFCGAFFFVAGFRIPRLYPNPTFEALIS